MKLRSALPAVLFALQLTALCSCASLDPVREQNADIIPLNESNCRLLEGRYSAQSGDLFFTFPEFILLDELPHPQNARGFRWAELTVLDEHTLQFSFPHLNGNEQVHTLEGHFEEGCFYVDYCRDATGALPLFWAAKSDSRRICLHESRKLLCSHSRVGLMFFVALPIGVYSDYDEFLVDRLND